MPESSEANEKWWLGYCYTINSIIGVGILAIPWAYANCGWILGIFVQMLVLYISLTASYLTLATWGRVETIAQLKEAGIKVIPVAFLELFSWENNYKSVNLKDNSNLNEPLLVIENEVPTIRVRKFDVYEIMHLTLGNKWSFSIATIMISGYYPILTAYYAVFSKSMASNVQIFGYTCNLYEEPEYFGRCRNVYWGYLTFFGVMMMILSWFKQYEHRWMQLMLTLFRFLVFLIMMITGIYARLTNTQLEGTLPNNAHPVDYDLTKFSSILFIIIFASLFENTIPTTTGFIKDKSKYLPRVINLSCLTFNILYISVGLVLCFCIENPQEVASLNWRNYSAGYSSDERPWWTYVIAYIVILLPAMDIASAFPIISGNVADNLISIVYGHEEAHKISHVRSI